MRFPAALAWWCGRHTQSAEVNPKHLCTTMWCFREDSHLIVLWWSGVQYHRHDFAEWYIQNAEINSNHLCTKPRCFLEDSLLIAFCWYGVQGHRHDYTERHSQNAETSRTRGQGDAGTTRFRWELLLQWPYQQRHPILTSINLWLWKVPYARQQCTLPAHSWLQISSVTKNFTNFCFHHLEPSKFSIGAHRFEGTSAHRVQFEHYGPLPQPY